MRRYEYKVIPAPSRGQKARGVKTPQDRFALALESALNTHAEEGWEFVRAEALPSEERQGLTSTTTTYRNVLVFRRQLDMPQAEEPEASAPTLLEDHREDADFSDDAAQSERSDEGAAPEPDGDTARAPGRDG